MKVEWSDQRCIVCLRPRDTGEQGLETTKGHVIPEAIGGRLWSPFLCKGCNSKMGTIEEELLNDVSVVLMAKQLLPDLPPKLGLNIHSRAGYFRDDEEHGRLYARPRRDDGELELTATDARTRRSEDVRGEVERKLRAAGEGDKAVAGKLAEYDALPPGDDFEWEPGKKVPKPIDLSGQTFGPTYDEPIVPLVVPFGIAYLFLACCLRESIYDSRFDSAREVMHRAMDGDLMAADGWPIDQLRSVEAASPLHGIAFQERNGQAGVRVVIFRWLVWFVHFPKATTPSEVLHYSRVVSNGDEDCNLSHLA